MSPAVNAAGLIFSAQPFKLNLIARHAAAWPFAAAHPWISHAPLSNTSQRSVVVRNDNTSQILIFDL